MADDPKTEPIPDLKKLEKEAIATHGDQPNALAATIAHLIAARQDLAAARAQLPKDGSLVLAGDDAKAWAAYTSLGKPSDLRKLADEHGKFSAENASLKRKAELRDVAAKAGVNPAVLERIDDPTLVYGTAKAKDRAGKDVEVVTVKAGDAAAEPLLEYAERTAPELMPALKPAAPAETGWQGRTPSRADPTRHTQPAPGELPDLKAQILAHGLASF